MESIKIDSFLSLQSVKKILSDEDVFPRRRFGQNFLVDRHALEKIAQAAQLGTEDNVLEVGPGLGALTGLLVKQAKKVLAVEIDEKLASFLKNRFQVRKNFSLLQADILEADLPKLLKESFGSAPFTVMGNLPYRISTQILFRFLECSVQPRSMIFAFQWEVAERLWASPGTKDYGAMTLTAQFYAQVEKVLKIKKASFYPAPEIDTGVVKFIPRKLDLKLTSEEEQKLLQWIRFGFAQRRKTLKNALTNSSSLPYTGEDFDRALNKIGLPVNVRAENLKLVDFANLVKIFR
ncbi:MAG: ribosomal RNA small subunit methyltransferase A [Chlamydiae bacterium]|nr:ribosomal RNA small subunit methyltransferase A [Chlamydiota bacterium]MBI3265714.1 ribosomal RNA small subunit methyltransferase A [Chlamydiota bacterium]